MVGHGIMGAALGNLMDGEEEHAAFEVHFPRLTRRTRLSTEQKMKGTPLTPRYSRRRAMQTTLSAAAVASLPRAAATSAMLAVGRPALAEAQTSGATPDGAGPSDLVDIGDRSIYIERGGAGEPTVVFESGARNNGQIWSMNLLPPTWEPTATARTMVLPGVAAFTSVVAYDRPGTFVDLDNLSRSDPVPMPRTAADMVKDLHAVLDVADVSGPYVLVGHSLGGLLVRLYASTYPEEVAGMVQIDPYHEEVWARYEAALSPAEWEAIDEINSAVPQELIDAYPEYELVDFDASNAQMRNAAADSPLRPMPLIVLTQGRSFGADTPPEAMPPGFRWEILERETRDLYTELTALVPGGSLIVAEESGHYIQLEQPDLVIEAIRQVVDAVRDPSSWTT